MQKMEENYGSNICDRKPKGRDREDDDSDDAGWDFGNEGKNTTDRCRSPGEQYKHVPGTD